MTVNLYFNHEYFLSVRYFNLIREKYTINLNLCKRKDHFPSKRTITFLKSAHVRGEPLSSKSVVCQKNTMLLLG